MLSMHTLVKSILIVTIILTVTHLSLQQQQEEEDYPDDVIDQCNFYDTAMSDECHHEKFLSSPTLESKYGQSVKKCCKGHSYKFHDHCEERENKGESVCGAPGVTPYVPQTSVTCPAHCKKHTLEEDEFIIESGEIRLKKSVEGLRIHDYCSYYHCGAIWSVEADVCLCYESKIIEESARAIPDGLTQCCEQNSLLSHATFMAEHNGKEDTYQCPLDSHARLTTNETKRAEKNRSCDTKFIEIDYKNFVTFNGTDLYVRQHLGVKEQTFSIESHEYCAGVMFRKDSNFNKSDPLHPVLLTCARPLCDGKSPCLRTCCEPDELFIHSSCRKMNESHSEEILNIQQLKNIKLNLTNMAKAPSSQRRCRKNHRNINLRCANEYNLSLGDIENVNLEVFTNDKIYDQSKFCVYFTEDLQIQPEICKENSTNSKFGFYPYILLLSAFCLLATLIIYSKYPKLLNHYTRIMRHFTISMMFAFIILSINQLTPVGNFSTSLCIFFGFAEQYLFLVTFTLMTAMSTEIWMQMSGKPSTNIRYRTQVVSGYLFPLIVTAATLITEYAAPPCASYRPRFGEEHCFFLRKTAKGIWFFLPIGLMLLINFSMFVSTIVVLSKLDREKRRFNMRSPSQRSENMEKFLMYLKLFLGMGFIWSFEIIAGLASDEIHESSWYVTDIINMLQGVYVFIIFVCKRNVFDLVLNRTKKRGQTANTNRVINAITKKKSDKDNMELESMSGGHSNTTHMTEG